MRISITIFCITILAIHVHAQQFETFVDSRDGKIYKTVKIESQTWMAENLSYKPSTGGYSPYNLDEKNVSIYGYLYDWLTAKSVCPIGWHLPTYDEFELLGRSAGGQYKAGRDLKSETNWNPPNSGAANETGFSAIAGGFRDNNYVFHDIGVSANFWNITLTNSDELAWYTSLQYNQEGIFRHYIYCEYQLSVRCIKD